MSDDLAAVARGRAALVGNLTRRLGSRADAEDLVQSALLRALERAEDLRDRDKLVPWFGRILETSLANHRRRRAAESRMESRLGPDSHAPAPVADLHWLSCQGLEAALASIRPDQAGLVRSVDLRGIPLRQVARELGVRSNTAAARLHRARRATARALVQLCRFCRLHWGFDCSCLVASGQAAAGPSGHR